MSDDASADTPRVNETDVWLTPHDMDHLNDGQPVFKSGEENQLLVLRSASWDVLESREADDAE